MSGILGSPEEVSPRWLVRATYVALVVVLATYALIRIGYKDIPLERDEGAYVYMGRELLKGGVPYVDFFEMKPPGIYYTYALLYAISGGDLAWMHVWMALFVAVGALFLHGIARSWLGSGPALVVTVAYSALAVSLHASGVSLQSEHFVLLFVLAGLYVLDRGLERGLSWAVVVAGVLLSWSVSIKQNAVFFVAFSIAYVLFAHPVQEGEQRSYARIRYLALLAAGALLPLVAFFLIMLLQGSLGQFWFWVVEVSGEYVGATTISEAKELLFYTVRELFQESPVLWVLAGAGVPLLVVASRPWWKRLAMGLFLLMSALSVVPGLRFYGHYFLLLFPAVAICVGGFMYGSVHWLMHRTGRRTTGAALFIAAIGLFMGIVVRQRAAYFGADHNAVLRSVYGTNPFPEARLVSDLVNERIREGDGLMVMGFEPQIYLYTNTNSPTRWINPIVLMIVHPLSDSIRNEVRAALAASPPRFVVWVQHGTSWATSYDVDPSFLEEYWGQLHRDYEVIAWYEQRSLLMLNVVTGEEARDHAPRGTNYLFLAERRAGPHAPSDE